MTSNTSKSLKQRIALVDWNVRLSPKYVKVWGCTHHIYLFLYIQVSSVQFSRSFMSNSLQPHGMQHSRLPCPSPTPGACSNSCPLSQWFHRTISSYVIPFSSCLQNCPTSGSFPMSQLFTSGGQSIGVSALIFITYTYIYIYIYIFQFDPYITQN